MISKTIGYTGVHDIFRHTHVTLPFDPSGRCCLMSHQVLTHDQLKPRDCTQEFQNSIFGRMKTTSVGNYATTAHVARIQAS